MSQGLKYVVDIVFCIDSTGSMGPVIEKVKEAALKFHDDLNSEMSEKNKAIASLRVKVISFRDYWADGSGAIAESAFFKLPEERGSFSAFVDGVRAEGGGDDPENGLEALAMAIRSDWSREGDRRRQLIVVYTDAPAHPLDRPAKPAGYPAGLPANLDELTDMWEGQSYLSKNAKRLILHTPDAEPWTPIAAHWTNTLHHASKAGAGMAEVTYSEILGVIAESVGG